MGDGEKDSKSCAWARGKSPNPPSPTAHDVLLAACSSTTSLRDYMAVTPSLRLGDQLPRANICMSGASGTLSLARLITVISVLLHSPLLPPSCCGTL